LWGIHVVTCFPFIISYNQITTNFFNSPFFLKINCFLTVSSLFLFIIFKFFAFLTEFFFKFYLPYKFDFMHSSTPVSSRITVPAESKTSRLPCYASFCIQRQHTFQQCIKLSNGISYWLTKSPLGIGHAKVEYVQSSTLSNIHTKTEQSVKN
jgi:hypothetical protein